jgi:energy-coupling factor transporter ATP-binding protein EcfA2
MLLRNLSYEENSGTTNLWQVNDISFNNVTLVVGKNSSGKTRLLNLIDNLSKLVSGRHPATFGSGSWNCKFERYKNKALEQQQYTLTLKNRAIQEEHFEINDQKIMQRNEYGLGFVLKKSNRSRVNYKVPQNQLMTVVRRDEIQHPFFDHLYKWGSELCYYRFGSDFGKNSYTVIGPQEVPSESEFPLSSLPDNAAHVYRKTYERFTKSYKDAILSDLRQLDYPCKDILFGAVNALILNGTPPMQLGVLEEDRTSPTFQSEMSQGMYRALAILIQLNANILWTQATKVGRPLATGDTPSIIIDDIGEGLDFERAKSLVKLLMRKATEYNIQLIMSSNDRFIMNSVPLENWLVLHRKGQRVRGFDYENSKDVFDQFQYSGLNNFDFFSNEVFLSEQREQR